MATTVDERTNGRGMQAAIDELGEAVQELEEARRGVLPGQRALFAPAGPSWEELGEQLDRVERLRQQWQLAKESVKEVKAQHDMAAQRLRDMRLEMRYRRAEAGR